jgi:5-methylcytosine-specific restriction protein B
VFAGSDDPTRIRVVQFHASYAYEDFVQGYRPDGKGGFERRDGIFVRACQVAKTDPGQRYVLIIDDINRANLSKVFGELLMLVESDKRDKKFALELAYSTEADERFYVPENLHIIGLMNTADRSLALVDYALRRRFKFFDIAPGFETPEFHSYLLARGVPEPVIDHIRLSFGQLNKAVAQDRDLGSGFLIGHSYFCDLPAEEDAEDAYNEIVEHEIVPLLREYWYEGSQAEEWRQKLLKR